MFNLMNFSTTQKLVLAILGGVFGGQMVSSGLESMGIYNLYNPLWNIAIGLIFLVAVAKYLK